MDAFFQNLINGVQLGSIYVLIALGYTMVYGVLRLINFAHSDVFMVGSFVGFYTATGSERWAGSRSSRRFPAVCYTFCQ